MSQIIKRPEATGKKINCREEFELCYLRHQYFRRVTYNPTETEMKPYYRIIRQFTARTFYTYLSLFQHVGLDLDDLLNIGKVHLISYLGLYSVNRVPAKYDEFLDVFIEKKGFAPTELDVLNKDKANFTQFLKQRMEDMVRIARQKVRNIKGLLAEEYLVFYGPKMPPEARHELAKDYENMGFKKLDVTLFKAIKRKMKGQEGPVYKLGDIFYVTVPLDHRNLTILDLQGAGMDPYESVHNMNPEQILCQLDTERQFEENKKNWYSEPKEERNKKIRKFIRAFKDDPRYSEEVKIAKRIIKRSRKVKKCRKKDLR